MSEVDFGGEPIVRFLDVPPRQDFLDWTERSLRRLDSVGFGDWIDIPVFFTNEEMMDFLCGGMGQAIGSLDFAGDNLVNFYEGEPPLPKAVYEELDQHQSVLTVGLNYPLVVAEEEPLDAIATTLFHEIGHGVYRVAPDSAREAWHRLYSVLSEQYADSDVDFLFKYGVEESFAELFMKHVGGYWWGPEEENIRKAFLPVIPLFRDY